MSLSWDLRTTVGATRYNLPGVNPCSTRQVILSSSSSVEANPLAIVIFCSTIWKNPRAAHVLFLEYGYTTGTSRLVL